LIELRQTAQDLTMLSCQTLGGKGGVCQRFASYSNIVEPVPDLCGSICAKAAAVNVNWAGSSHVNGQ
jgi:hypothetical protein